MRTEQEIRERIEMYDNRLDGCVQGSPSWNRIQGKKQSLEWVLEDE